MTSPAESETKRTPLYDIHRQLGARMVAFGGWDMPVEYSGILAEHQAEDDAIFEGVGIGE